jgi:FixJ family two-component response regulator
MPSAPLTIVVVEDHPSVTKTIKRVLKAGGFAVIPFDSAEAALEADATASADCLILDIRLPGMSGFEMYRRLALSGKVKPTVFITASDDPAVRQEAERLAGVGRYLPKPFFGTDLLDAVTRACDRGAGPPGTGA